jgi:hypothetical protein
MLCVVVRRPWLCVFLSLAIGAFRDGDSLHGRYSARIRSPYGGLWLRIGSRSRKPFVVKKCGAQSSVRRAAASRDRVNCLRITYTTYCSPTCTTTRRSNNWRCRGSRASPSTAERCLRGRRTARSADAGRDRIDETHPSSEMRKARVSQCFLSTPGWTRTSGLAFRRRDPFGPRSATGSPIQYARLDSNQRPWD